jgi:hypothetical protein
MNKLLIPSEFIISLLLLLDKAAEKLPEEKRLNFKVQLLKYISGSVCVSEDGRLK